MPLNQTWGHGSASLRPARETRKTMPKRRSQVALSPEEEAVVLDEGRTIQIASIGPDGFPHLVAMWYAVIDGDICFSTYGTSQKVLNLQRDPRVTAMVELGHDYNQLRGVVIKGKATVVDAGSPERATLEPLLAKELAPRYGGTGTGGLSPKRVIIRIHPEKTYSWDHRKLAAGVH